jgi:tetratricopeptide (TPR) repeat protein
MRSIDNAVALWKSGRLEDAIHEFDALAEASSDVNEKSALMISEARCYADLGRLAEAERTLEKIRKLAPDETEMRFLVDFWTACVAGLRAQYGEAVLCFQQTLEEYADLLKTAEYRDLYEEIQQRKAFCLVHLTRYGEAITILSEASSFATLSQGARQEVHLNLGTCYAQLHEHQPAKDEFLRVIEFGLKNSIEAQARYSLGVVYFLDGGFAQAKYQLETFLQDYQQDIPNVSRKNVYYQLSRVYHYLGEKENAKRYEKLAKNPST